MSWLYLDNNATTEPAAEVIEAMTHLQQVLWANPSSVHRFGQMVRHQIDLSRQKVADLVGGPASGLVFTSGGTEANNLALGAMATRCRPAHRDRLCIVTTAVEHAAIRQPADALASEGFDLQLVPVDGNGVVHPEALHEVLQKSMSESRPVLVSIQWANNETGVIQPIAQLSAVCDQYASARRRGDLLFHSDATQAAGKIPVAMSSAGIDMMTLSAHKFHGPKGVGALCLRRGVRIGALNHGGPQERDRRGGTENVAGIVGFAVAAEMASAFLKEPDERCQLAAARNAFEADICQRLPETVINGVTASDRLWNTTNLGFPRLEAEAILVALSEQRVCASAGAACSSGSLEPSPVLLAAGVPEDVAHGSLRFSFSRFTPKDDLDSAVDIIAKVVKKVGSAMYG